MHAMHNGGIPLWAPVSPLCTYVEIHLFTKIQIFQHCEFLELGTFAFFWGKPETAERNAEGLVTRSFSLSGGGRYFTVDL